MLGSDYYSHLTVEIFSVNFRNLHFAFKQPYTAIYEKTASKRKPGEHTSKWVQAFQQKEKFEGVAKPSTSQAP